MGRQSNIVGAVAFVAVLLSWCGSAIAQPSQSGRRIAPMPAIRRSPPMNPRERWLSLPPDERQVFRRNAERWMQMGPEERKLMRERDRIYRERIKREVDAALRDSGLHLDGEKRAEFEQRYIQERRRIEQNLRQETEARRQQQLPALKERLKKEFQEPSSPTISSPAAAASARP